MEGSPPPTSDAGELPEIVQFDPNAPAADDAVTDGVWVAVRVGRQVALSQLATTGPAMLTGVTGTRTVPDGVTEMALREPAGGGGGSSPL